MKKWLAAFAICGMAATGPAWAEDLSKNALAEELVVLMDLQKSTDEVFETLRRSIGLQALQAGKVSGSEGAAKAKEDSMKILDLIQGELSWDRMKGRYVAMYAETFNEEELQGIIAFYKSPAGQAFVKKQPELAKRSLELNQQLMIEMMPKIKALNAPPAKGKAPVEPGAK